MGLIDDVGVGPVALDTCVFIYFIEEHERYFDIVRPLFEAIDIGRLAAVTSSLTLMETLVLPYRQGEMRLLEEYQTILTNSHGLKMAGLSLAVLNIAASLRARTGMRTPDALQIASAVHNRCTAFVTNDRRLPNAAGLPIIQIGDYAA
ncbi:MAG TPA: type II toxin-antitoxin system VapC family toxin [Gammaproteobacteria bacterium]|nr:type II toxin-antitoxin system VapC family toxin [Gammaproteobacteria bacterium]